MKASLLLSLSYMPNNESRLGFKSKDDSVRISRLSNALGFIGNMKHLIHAIDHQGRQDCAYELKNWEGLQWVLNCKLTKGIVALDLWFQNFGFEEQLRTTFSWQGNTQDFRDSINHMIDQAGHYKYFKKY